MGNRNQKKTMTKTSIKTRANYSILSDELADDSADPTGPADHSDPGLEVAGDGGSLPSGAQLASYLKAATANFERMMEKAMKSMIDSIGKVEKALEFEGLRINDLEKKNVELEERIDRMDKVCKDLQERVGSQDREVNKAERFSRRNNFRIIGIAEPKEDASEDCVKLVEDILKSKFELDVKVERAHRDGRKGNKPRHIIVKIISDRDKVHVMKNAREVLQREKYYFADDLTKADLSEKKKHIKEVQELYTKGTKLRFFAGLWRGNGGVPYFTA